MSDLQIVVRKDGVETDVTEAVQIMYDVVHASMDWGSGFLDTEEYATVYAFADVAGFEPPNEAYSGVWPASDKGKAIKTKTAEIRAMFKSIPVVRPS